MVYDSDRMIWKFEKVTLNKGLKEGKKETILIAGGMFMWNEPYSRKGLPCACGSKINRGLEVREGAVVKTIVQ